MARCGVTGGYWDMPPTLPAGLPAGLAGTRQATAVLALVDADVVKLEVGRELGGRVGRAGPAAADGQVHVQVECLGVGLVEPRRGLRRSGPHQVAVNEEAQLTGLPLDGVGVPIRRCREGGLV